MSKIMEMAIKNRLMKFLNRYNLFSIQQNDFMDKRSVESALSVLFNEVTDAFDTKRKVRLLAYDLSKAFDSINHQISKQGFSRHSSRKGVLVGSRWRVAYHMALCLDRYYSSST
ncbi:hypothetical protein HHI36_019337 [Cryptolaemus montrouzieri]|uniref:Reverse transcriptase domain-containing protein n=1 Tax=Cryptolaemus montrouzieri TaxID=559131 RepID=A0ABD2P2W6_9CUCU